MKIKSIKLIIFIIWIIIGLNTQLSYPFFALIILVYILTDIKTFKFQQNIIIKKNFLFWIPNIFIGVWAYGLILGFLNNNKLEYILANFAGMTVFLIYYVFHQLHIKRHILSNIIILSGITTALISCIAFVNYFFRLGLDPFIGKTLDGSSTGQLRQLFINQNVGLSLWCICLFVLIANKKQKQEFPVFFKNKLFRTILLFIFLSFAVLFIPASKGFILACIVYFFFAMYSLHFKRISKGYMSFKLLFAILLMFIMLVVFIITGYSNIMESMFNSDDEANIPRFIQLEFLLDDLTFWGKGLGAIIEGYSRNNTKEYGFELVYLNLFHKFGIFALLLIYSYMYIVIFAIKQIRKKKNVFYSIVALSNMAFLWPSIGNPMIFSPSMVILTCISIYLLNNENDISLSKYI